MTRCWPSISLLTWCSAVVPCSLLHVERGPPAPASLSHRQPVTRLPTALSTHTTASFSADFLVTAVLRLPPGSVPAETRVSGRVTYQEHAEIPSAEKAREFLLTASTSSQVKSSQVKPRRRDASSQSPRFANPPPPTYILHTRPSRTHREREKRSGAGCSQPVRRDRISFRFHVHQVSRVHWADTHYRTHSNDGRSGQPPPATPSVSLHPSSSPIDSPRVRKSTARHLGWSINMAGRRPAWARTRPPSNQHVAAPFGSSVSRGRLRRGPPSNDGSRASLMPRARRASIPPKQLGKQTCTRSGMGAAAPAQPRAST